MSTVVLFDIDGTLIDCGGAGRRAMESAFERRHGRADACASIAFGGMTDRAIVRRGLEAIGSVVDADTIDALIADYLELLASSLPNVQSFRVIESAKALIEHTESLGFAVGLGTGNVRRGAMLKLGRASLADRFAFGGFGCDAEDRAELLMRGAERGAELLGLAREGCRVLVVGDTPRDVSAAHTIGAQCLAVTTGRHGFAELEAAGADCVVESLATDEALAFARG
jgi:phosphoglycolate phosphatase-like HAD superfamily hydrolase